MKQIGQSNSRHTQVYVNQFYDVVAQNGIIIGSVRYAFVDGDGVWCIAIQGHNGMPYHGKSMHEIGSLFDLKEGEPTWALPVVMDSGPVRQPPPEVWNKLLGNGVSSGFKLLTYTHKENLP